MTFLRLRRPNAVAMLGSLCEKLGELTRTSTGNSWYFTSQEIGEKDQNQKGILKLDGKKERRKAF